MKQKQKNKKVQFIHIPQTAYSNIKFLKKANQQFELQETGSSQLIRHNNYRYFYSDKIVKRKYMYLFQDIRKHVTERLDDLDIDLDVERLKPLYFKFRDVDLEAGEVLEFRDVCQYDVNKAYYTIARNMGVISEEYYQKYLALPKFMRLILIGSLATRKTIRSYKGSEVIDHRVKEDDTLRSVFKRIVVETDKILLQMSKALNDQFIYYWVDGITVKDTKKAQDIVRYYEAKNNLQFSYEKLKFVRLEQRESLVAVVDTGEKIKELHNRKVFKA